MKEREENVKVIWCNSFFFFFFFVFRPTSFIFVDKVTHSCVEDLSFIGNGGVE